MEKHQHNHTMEEHQYNHAMGKAQIFPRGFGTAVLLFLPQGHQKNPPKLKWSCCTHVMYMISCVYNQLSVYYIINCSVAHCELVHIVLH